MTQHQGFAHAGYYAPDCEQFTHNVMRGDPIKFSGHDQGWRYVGFTDPSCQDFNQAVPVVSSAARR